jgi:hypothetical protein
MADGPFDFAVLGSNPLALLLAGLLASTHKKSVALVVETHSSFRLTRGFDLSVGPMTRPETWGLLKSIVPEVRRLLATIGAKTAIDRVDPLLVSETEAGAEALQHIRHIVLANAVPIERLTYNGAWTTYRIQDAWLFRRSLFEAPAMKWLEKNKVQIVAADGVTVTLKKDGARIERGDTGFDVAQVIAADDNAILQHLDAEERQLLLRTDTATTVLTEPMKSLPAPLTLVVDRGISLLQRKGGMVQALAAGGADTVARMGSRLSAGGRVRRAGQTGFGTVVPVDGAPMVGLAKSLKASVVSGLGPSGAFLAPAIARHFASAATTEEQGWFAARAPDAEKRITVSEYSGALALGSAS